MTKGIEAALQELSGDPALAGLHGRDVAVVAWDSRAGRLLWASPAAQDFARAAASTEGVITPGIPAQLRLAALAGGLAPRAGSRVERLRFSADAADTPAEVACRLLTVDGEDVLLTIFAGEPPSRIGGAEPPDPVPETRAPPFVERVRAHGRRRFIWSMDREGRFVSVSPLLGEVVGPENADVAGLTWAEVVERWVVDEHGAIAEDLARRATWSDATVLWRVTDTTFVVPVDLGGMPVFGRGHEFDGFRGFGLCRADEVQPAPDSPARAAPAGELILAEPAPAEAPIPALSLPDETTLADLAFEPIQARIGAQLGGTRSVPLRAVPEPEPQARASAAPPRTSPPPDDADAPSEAKPNLSVAERGALREIARALGARLEADDEEEGVPPRGSAEIVQISSARPRDPDAARLLDAMPIGVAVLRGETPVYANRFALDLLGYRDLGEMRAAPRLFVGRLDPRRGSTVVLAKTGLALPVEVKLAAAEWGDGPASLLLLSPQSGESSADAVRSLELEIARRDARIQEVVGTLDIAGIGVVTIDGAGRILSVNGPAERMLGYRENEIAGEGFTTLIAVESHRTAIDLVDRSLVAGSDAGGNGEVELLGRRAAGDTVPLLARAGRIATDAGAATALVIRDVSGFRRTETQLTQARQAAEAATARQSEFLARVSHEVRTPLNAIIGFSEIMMEERFGPVGSERYKHYLRDIHASGSHVVSLVSDLLDLAKVTSGRSELTFTSLNLNEVVAGSVGLMRPAAARERVILRTSFAAGLPRLIADERSIRQIALNFVSNAVRFTSAGGQVIVSTSLTERGEVVFRVRDTGIGMSPEELEAALEPFRQVSVVRREDGTGLGLPLAKALAEANRGAFTISSRRGQGTLVEVLFPSARVLAEG